MGLRVSEIVVLRVEDVDSRSMKVLIHRAKGKKDRYVNLPHSVLQDLREYYLAYRPTTYLFEGKNGSNKPYSVRSAQMIFKNAMKKAGVCKTIGIYGLHHPFVRIWDRH